MEIKIKPGDCVKLRVKSISIKGDYVYVTLEHPDIEYPYSNYPSLRVYHEKISLIEPMLNEGVDKSEGRENSEA